MTDSGLRPPHIESSDRRVIIAFNNVTIAETSRALLVLEDGHPPSWYIPPEDVRVEHLQREQTITFCEWKGFAHYYTIDVDGKKSPAAAWGYSDPNSEYLGIKHHVAFYANRVDTCTVDGVAVIPEGGEFYGGWITANE
ncbi:MAG: DUF427 domain-containing protein [Thermomicrobiales bacterium]